MKEQIIENCKKFVYMNDLVYFYKITLYNHNVHICDLDKTFLKFSKIAHIYVLSHTRIYVSFHKVLRNMVTTK